MKNNALPTRAALSFVHFINLRLCAKVMCVAGIGLLTANCASNKSRIDPKYGVAPSPQKYGENDTIPKGGGRNHTGKPYTISGRVYVPKADATDFTEEGTASWYGPGFHGRKTANGEFFDQHSFTAAHTTLPLPSYVRVTNLDNSRSIIVRVNDRGPFAHNRVIDLSQKTAEALEFRHKGTARVRVDFVGKASTDGSDDNLLLASLTTDGRPAQLKGFPEQVMVASLSPSTSQSIIGTPSQALAFNSNSPSNVDIQSPEAVFLKTGNSDEPEVRVKTESDE